jgi:hypothetical protein
MLARSKVTTREYETFLTVSLPRPDPSGGCSLSVATYVRGSLHGQNAHSCVFWRLAVTFTILAGAGFLLMLALVLFTVLRLRPESFKLRATLTKWISLDLEMKSKVQEPRPRTELITDDEQCSSESRAPGQVVQSTTE